MQSINRINKIMFICTIYMYAEMTIYCCKIIQTGTESIIRKCHILGFGKCVWFAIASASIASVLLSHSSRPVELRSPVSQIIFINYIKDSLSMLTNYLSRQEQNFIVVCSQLQKAMHITAIHKV